MGRDDKDYYGTWTESLDTDDTTNSVMNILKAVEEFKQRSSEDKEVVFILLSSLWDNHRYKFLYPTIPFTEWIMQYQHNYTALVAEMLVENVLYRHLRYIYI